MSLSEYTRVTFRYNELDFVVKAFYDAENIGYIIIAFFADNTRANNFSYKVNYETNKALLCATGDNAIGYLIERAKEDVQAGYYFGG